MRVSLQIDDFALDVKRLTVLGLITNELITNAKKFAYHGNRVGHLSVQCRNDTRAITLCVRDDGTVVTLQFPCDRKRPSGDRSDAAQSFPSGFPRQVDIPC